MDRCNYRLRMGMRNPAEIVFPLVIGLLSEFIGRFMSRLIWAINDFLR